MTVYSHFRDFHGGNTGSNPVGDANNPKHLAKADVSAEGSEGSNKKKWPLGRTRFCPRGQDHFHQFRLCCPLRGYYRLSIGIGGHLVIGMA